MAYLGVVDGKETVRNVLDLFEGLPTATRLEEVFVVDVEVAFLRIFYFVTDTELTVEECFAFVAFVNTGTENVHQIAYRCTSSR